MSDETPHQCQLYLITPPRLARDSFPDLLAELLDAVPIAAVRLELETTDEEVITHAADALRGICHARDVPLMITDHYRVVRRLGLDGVHLKGTRHVRDARQELNDTASIGTFCGTSRHAGMSAGEAGADYISFGPASISDLGSQEKVEQADLKWWNEMIELPSVVEGGLTLDLARDLAPVTDFLALGPEVWNSETTPLQALRSYEHVISLNS